MMTFLVIAYIFTTTLTFLMLVWLSKKVIRLITSLAIIDAFFGQQITFNDGILEAVKLSMKDEYDEALKILIEESERDK